MWSFFLPVFLLQWSCSPPQCMLLWSLWSGRVAGQTWSFSERGRPLEVHPSSRGCGQRKIWNLQTATQSKRPPSWSWQENESLWPGKSLSVMCNKYFYKIDQLNLSVQHGADPSKKNRDGNMPLDMVKDGDTDIQDLLRGDAALLDAAKKGCLARVQKLCSPENINCRDTQGRNSTPLHLAGTSSSDVFVYFCTE